MNDDSPRPIQTPERRRFLRLTMVNGAIWAAFALFIGLWLERGVHLANGLRCAGVWVQHAQSASACDAWRHHRAMTALWVVVVFAAVEVAMFVQIVRSLRAVARAGRMISY